MHLRSELRGGPPAGQNCVATARARLAAAHWPASAGPVRFQEWSFKSASGRLLVTAPLNPGAGLLARRTARGLQARQPKSRGQDLQRQVRGVPGAHDGPSTCPWPHQGNHRGHSGHPRWKRQPWTRLPRAEPSASTVSPGAGRAGRAAAWRRPGRLRAATALHLQHGTRPGTEGGQGHHGGAGQAPPRCIDRRIEGLLTGSTALHSLGVAPAGRGMWTRGSFTRQQDRWAGEGAVGGEPHPLQSPTHPVDPPLRAPLLTPCLGCLLSQRL